TVVPAAISPSTVARIIRRTPAQREPAEANTNPPATTPSPSEADAEPRSADPAHQCRSIIRVPVAERSGSPGPRAIPIHPAAVVEGSESPRRVIHPGPAPGSNPCPATVTIRRPAHRHRSRHPDRAVRGGRLPRAVSVEILISNHARRDVARGQGISQPLVAHLSP